MIRTTAAKLEQSRPEIVEKIMLNEIKSDPGKFLEKVLEWHRLIRSKESSLRLHCEACPSGCGAAAASPSIGFTDVLAAKAKLRSQIVPASPERATRPQARTLTGAARRCAWS